MEKFDFRNKAPWCKRGLLHRISYRSPSVRDAVLIISIPSGTIAIVEGSCGLCILQPVLCIAIGCYVSGGVAFNIFQTLARIEHKTITMSRKAV